MATSRKTWGRVSARFTGPDEMAKCPCKQEESLCYTGEDNAVRKSKLTVEERFLAKVNKKGPIMPYMDTPCWVWQASKRRKGYGAFQHGKEQLAHRVSYQLFIGLIPTGKQLDHLCKNTSCVNPYHLEPVTNQINCQRSERATKLQCIRGHVYSALTTRYYNEQRICTLCENIRCAAYRARKANKTFYTADYSVGSGGTIGK